MGRPKANLSNNTVTQTDTPQLTFGEEFGGTRCSDDAGLAAARAAGAIAAPAITAAVGADFDLEQFAVGSAGKRRERLAALRTLLLVGGQFQFLEDDG